MDNERSKAFALATVGSEIGFPPFIGWAIDSALHTNPWFTIIFAIGGLVVGLTHIIRVNQGK